MTTPRTCTEILAEIAAIPSMERGALSPMTSKSGNVYYNLQCWRDGRNHCTYVPRNQVEPVREAVANHARFQALVEEYAQVMEAQSRRAREQAGDGGSKKNGRRKSSRSPVRS
jgi:hypothetical protein